jgi:hypothetical protein
LLHFNCLPNQDPILHMLLNDKDVCQNRVTDDLPP